MLKKTVLSFSIIMGALCSAFNQTALAVENLLEARQGFTTKIIKTSANDYTFTEPPAEWISIIRYPGPLGDMAAYLSKPRDKTKKYPAIIWLTGGFPPGGGGEGQWRNRPRDNDQSAQSYWRSGVITLYPALRGSYGNPGQQEGFYGEVNDVLAAKNYLANLDYVDPTRIFLGGHSTGGTLALLVAATGADFAGILAFGPVADPVKSYGSGNMKHDTSLASENRLRAPVHYLQAVKSPTYVIEGTRGNIQALNTLKHSGKDNAQLNFFPIQGADHFNVLHPLNNLIANKILTDATFSLNQNEAQTAFDEITTLTREVTDIRIVAQLREQGVDFKQPHHAIYFLAAREKQPLADALESISAAGFKVDEIDRRVDQKRKPFYFLRATKPVVLFDLTTVFENTHQIYEIANTYQFSVEGWDIAR